MKNCKYCNEFMCGASGTEQVSKYCGKEKEIPCPHYNKAYGPVQSGMRQWVCRDCGQQGEEKDDKFSGDYDKTLLRHMKAGTLKGK
jgi:hypothetical protein